MTTSVYGYLHHRFHGDDRWVATGYLRTVTENGMFQLEHAIAPLGLRAKRCRDARGRPTLLISPMDQAAVDKLSEWAEPLRVDPPCTLFDCAPQHRRFGRTYGRHRIDGCDHSIDHGPDFELELPYVDLVTKPLPFLPNE